jgi:AsmA protein
VRVQLAGGKLDLNLSEMALYNGNGKLQLNVDASGKTPAIKSTFALSGLQAEPFLTDAAKLEWLSGTTAMDMSVTTRGGSQKALANALNGSGKMAFTDGAVRGTNIAALLRGVATLNLDPKSWEESKTDFAELGGTFTIKDGILTNNDMALKSQLLRVNGAGTVGIGPRNIDYKAAPKLVGSLEGQGGAADMGGVPIEVHVTGPWSDPKTSYGLGGGNLLDMAKNPEALVSSLSKLGAIKDPAALAKQLGGGASGGVLDALKGLGGGGAGGGSPVDALKSLVPGGAGGGSGSAGGASPTDALKSLVPGIGSGSGSAPATDAATKAAPDTTQPPTSQPSPPNPAGALKKLFGN